MTLRAQHRSGILVRLFIDSGVAVRSQPAQGSAVAAISRLARQMGYSPRLLSALLVLAAGVSTTLHAEDSYYRWKDERGNMVVSDRPPEASIEYEVFSTGSSRFRRVSPGEGAVPAETTSRPGNRFETQDKADDNGSMDTVAVEVLPEKDPEICERARQNLETLQTAARIRVRDEAGELRYLSADEIETQRQNALDNIDVHCE